MSLYIGLMSGTSMDGVDAALVSFEDGERPYRIAHLVTAKYPAELRAELARAILPDTRLSLHEIASLNISVGRWFAHVTTQLLDESEFSNKDVVAIGSHGQTLRHSPDTDPRYSIQIGDPATIAVQTAITTVADFRSLDLAAGGQGAPLVPAFHAAYFRHEHERTIIVNIGGIANITVLPTFPSQAIDGFDTGPGNCLLDEWISQTLKQPYDDDGRWAASGHVSQKLLNTLMSDEYFQRPAPKSTGREYFNCAYISAAISASGLSGIPAEDVQATLAEFTAQSIVHGIGAPSAEAERLFICGGGVNNGTLVSRLRDLRPGSSVRSTVTQNIDPDAIEAAAFAWLAMQRLKLNPVRVTTASRADSARILGAVYEPS
jgi:anhydro-N-acetylmuramic acid kinase